MNNILQIKQKADKSTTDNIQQQVNNLVLGAVGDGNNPEVVQARGEYALLNDRLNANEYINKNYPIIQTICNFNGEILPEIDSIIWAPDITH